MKNITEDLSDPRLMYLKAILFVLGGIIASILILLECPSIRVALLLALTVWCFARAYYFMFYVIEHYVDPTYRYSSLWSFACYLCRNRQPQQDRHVEVQDEQR